jgi:hypothetical protein
MNPALWLVLAGTLLMILGVVSAVFGRLPLWPAVVLPIAGATIETPASLAFTRSRRKPAAGRGSQP